MGQRHVRKSCVRFVVLAVSFSAVLSLAAQAATAPVGATPGSFSVDPNGGANYTIPIQISPGSAGMAPSIALTYSKQVDNPLVGVGFSISGLSIISRCGGTIALDGAKGGVYYDSRDRFCLDGQRLIAVNGADGAHNTEYRTERESFARIFSYDTSVCGLDNGAAPSSGPACFKVFSKDGTVSEYGVSPDSRIQAAPKNGVVQTTVRLWALNKVQDTRGNYYTIQYEENIPTEITGEYRPVRIDYTGNVSAGLLPYNSVRFVYGSRTDVVPHYEAGSVIKVTQRLTNIQTYTDATLVRSYNLAYDNNGAVGASRLTSITECGDDGVCLPGTKLMWELASVGFGNTDMGSPGIWNRDYTNIITGDFNGDGKMDFIKQDGTSFQGLATLYLSNGDGTFTAKDMGAPGTWNRDYTNLIPGDFNGDGKTDFIKQNGTSWQGLATLYLSNGDGTFTARDMGSPGIWNRDYTNFITGDFNGDGKMDFIKQDGTWFQGLATLYLSNGDGTFTARDMGSPGIWNRDYTNIITGDFNGDGKMDFIKQDGTWFQGLATLYLSNGDGTFTAKDMGSPGTWNRDYTNFITGDFNGDGKTDFIKQDNTPWQGLGTVYLSRGDGTFNTIDMGSPGTWNRDYTNLIPGDFNGDGKMDFIKQNGTAWQGLAILYSNTPANKVSDFLTSVTNGLGATTTITHKPITDNTVYTKDPSVLSCAQPNPPPTNLAAADVNCYPYQNVQAATYVVSRVTQSDGVGGLNVCRLARDAKRRGGWVAWDLVQVPGSEIASDRSGLVGVPQDGDDR